MKKFGFGKKGDGDEDSNRSALFGSRSKNKSPNPSTNPYAQPPSASDPYTQAKLHAGVGGVQRGPSPSNDRYGQGTQQTRQGGYGGMNGAGYGGGDNQYGGNDDSKSNYATGAKGSGGGGYGPDKYGAQGGYGANRYGTGGAANSREGGGSSRYGPGGYGGLGPATDYGAPATEDSRDALFGGARERLQQKPPNAGQSGQPSPPPYDANYGQDGQTGGYGGGNGPSYEAYGDRQLTAEEEEEEDIEATKQEIRFMKQADVSSTRNALRIAAQAEETGRNTLARLGAQGERIHNTEKHLDLTANHNRVAEERARELKTLNKSMFAVHVSNPFTGASRRQQRDNDVLEKHQTDRILREATRREGYESDQRLQKAFKDMDSSSGGSKLPKTSLAERAKYQFEADEEDEQMENEIDSNIDALHGAATRLNGLAKATGKELEEQNRHLKRINDKVSDRSYTHTHIIISFLNCYFSPPVHYKRKFIYGRA